MAKVTPAAPALQNANAILTLNDVPRVEMISAGWRNGYATFEVTLTLAKMLRS
jgi:hypothetical protein